MWGVSKYIFNQHIVMQMFVGPSVAFQSTDRLYNDQIGARKVSIPADTHVCDDVLGAAEALH